MLKKYFMMVTVVIMVLMASMTAFAGVKKFGKYNRKAFEERMLERVNNYNTFEEWEVLEDYHGSLDITEDSVAFIGTWDEMKQVNIIAFNDDRIILCQEKDTDDYTIKNIGYISMTDELYDALYEGEIGIWGLRFSEKDEGTRTIIRRKS
jgi:hypothetical protein